MSDAAALLKAIVAHADEDTPRLAYADWLDEHDEPARAEFIRVQVALAAGAPSDADYPDLIERWHEVMARVRLRLSEWEPERPEGVRFYGPMHHMHDEDFRRGFPEVVEGDWGAGQRTPADAVADAFCTKLAEVFATTTVRSLELNGVTPQQLERILNARGAELVCGLSVSPILEGPTARDDVVSTIINARCAGTLERLRFGFYLPREGSLALAAAKGFERLREFDCLNMGCTLKHVARFSSAPWFKQLRTVQMRVFAQDVFRAFIGCLGKLQELHTIEFPDFLAEAARSFATTKGFAKLGRLLLTGCQISAADAANLAKARFPSLAVLELPRCGLKNDAIEKLCLAKWASQLRVLYLGKNAIGDKGLVALSKSPAAAGLRILQLGDNPIGKTALAALASGAFASLTTLDIGSTLKRKATAADGLKFVGNLEMPRWKHLILDRWPLGEAGAKELARNPAFANLTRLSLSQCEINTAGADALMRSPHLQNLVELHLDGNNIKDAPALLDKKVLPRLAQCRIYGNGISKKAHDALSAARPSVV
jgi:uncharacterized protein (TIGR02996 family)